MQGKDKIIDDILGTARRSAESMISEAEAESKRAAEELRAALAESERMALDEYDRAAGEVYSGLSKLGDLEKNKAILAAKQECVSAVYARVRQKILTAPDKEYLALLQKLIDGVCEDGDVVIAAKADDKRVTADFVKKVSAAAKKKLTLGKERGDFEGGVILRNDKYDRSITVDDIVDELKDRTVTQTAQKLEL